MPNPKGRLDSAKTGDKKVRKLGIFILGLLLYPNVGLFSASPAIADGISIFYVADTFVGRCPTWEDLGSPLDSSLEQPDCVCTKSHPPICQSTSLVMECAPTVGKCVCSQNCSSSGGGGAGCTSANCISDTSWSAGDTGYQKKVNRGCSGNSCVTTSTSYQCAPGYHGASTTNTIPTCRRCPTVDGVTGTSPAGTTTESGCYAPSGTVGSDTAGSFIYTADSNYC